MRVTFDLPPGVQLPRFIVADLPEDRLRALRGEGQYRSVVMSNGSLLRVFCPTMPDFKVTVVEPEK